MSARRVLVITGILVVALGLAALWWRQGTEVFLAVLGGMIC